MGYTHYWETDRALKVSVIQATLIAEILKEHADVLDIADHGPSVLDFNGIGEEAHENFYVEYGKNIKFAFCKTARKPYDIAVCKCLLVLSLSAGFNFSSDGGCDGKLDDESWPDALLWFISKGFESTITKKIVPYLTKND